ncbi:CTP synthase [Eubacteriales bacterium OttesenSCG-928-N14]|nr:CTP synthase [Eubacteriales bacterium OttesenSCG-928-N14]
MGTKYIFVTGGVISGLGKGITAASLGRLLKSRGYRVTMQKFDPYLNVDAGTMNPFQHGEVFVTEDGAETDLDLGHYERFIDENLSQSGNVTSGRVYWNVINAERRGDYGGGTVQLVPHITNEIKRCITADKQDVDIAIIEIGGTVGDIESLPFLEAIRQFASDIGRQKCVFIHVVLIPFIHASQEQKTKPTQHSVKELLSTGIQPDFIICRTERPLEQGSKDKIALFCNLPAAHIIENRDVDTLYEVPLVLQEERLDALVLKHFGMDAPLPDLSAWQQMVERIKHPQAEATIGVVGKYTNLPDAYISIVEALHHGGLANGAKVHLQWLDSSDITEQNAAQLLGHLQGILVPGGFGKRGIEGMIATANYARQSGTPYLGICLGMQIAAVSFARHVIGYPDAHSTEFAPNTPHPVIDLMQEQMHVTNRGGTMRLGQYPCHLADGSLCRKLYGKELIGERHRHRYEFNNAFRDAFTQHGALVAGLSPDDSIVEILEIPSHPFYIGVQFHPEYKSRPNRPHPLFAGFVAAALKG